jgi:hypothetical protein
LGHHFLPIAYCMPGNFLPVLRLETWVPSPGRPMSTIMLAISSLSWRWEMSEWPSRWLIMVRRPLSYLFKPFNMIDRLPRDLPYRFSWLIGLILVPQLNSFDGVSTRYCNCNILFPIGNNLFGLILYFCIPLRPVSIERFTLRFNVVHIVRRQRSMWIQAFIVELWSKAVLMKCIVSGFL